MVDSVARDVVVPGSARPRGNEWPRGVTLRHETRAHFEIVRRWWVDPPTAGDPSWWQVWPLAGPLRTPRTTAGRLAKAAFVTALVLLASALAWRHANVRPGLGDGADAATRLAYVVAIVAHVVWWPSLATDETRRIAGELHGLPLAVRLRSRSAWHGWLHSYEPRLPSHWRYGAVAAVIAIELAAVLATSPSPGVGVPIGVLASAMIAACWQRARRSWHVSRALAWEIGTMSVLMCGTVAWVVVAGPADALMVIAIGAGGLGALFGFDRTLADGTSHRPLHLVTVVLLSAMAILVGSLLEPSIWSGLVSADAGVYSPLTQAVLAGGLLLVFFPFSILTAEHAVTLHAEQSRLVADLRRTRTQLAAAQRAVGVMDERHRVGRELHDSVVQDLGAVVMLCETALDGARRGQLTTATNDIERARFAASAGLDDVRHLLAELEPLPFAPGSLADALRRSAARMQPDVAVNVFADDVVAVGGRAERAIWKVAQEALTNVVKHAGATAVTVSLQRSPAGTVRLVVRDDGVGFDQRAVASGHGLASIRARIDELGGSVELCTAPDRGTIVAVEVPG